MIHSTTIGVILGVCLPVVFFLIASTIERRAKQAARLKGAKIWWTLTPQKKVRNFETGLVQSTSEEVDFDPRHGHYMKCGEIIIALASASLVFIPSLHFTSVLPWIGLPMVLLGFTVVYSLSFMGLITYFYEMQLHNPDSFTAFRSNLIFSLGFGGLGCFAVAYFALSILIGNAVSSGALTSVAH
jgi:hypothetical protein